MGLVDRFGRALGTGLDLAAGAFEGMQKARRSPVATVTPSGDQVSVRTAAEASEAKLQDTEPMGAFFDRWAEYAPMGYVERPTTLGAGWHDLARIATTAPVAAVLATQQNGVAEFTVPQDDLKLPGFRIKLRGNATRSPTKAQRGRIEALTRFVVHCGDYEHIAQLTARDSFEAFTRKLFRDSFIYDQAVAQVVPTKASLYGDWMPARLIAMDAKTIRIARPPEDGAYVPDDAYELARFLQVDGQEMPVTAFHQRQLLFGVTQPRSDLEVGGYGYSRTEQLIDVMTAWLYGYGYNKNYFRQGANIKGVLTMDEMPPERMQRSFERYWRALITGVENAHRTPVLWGASGAKWLSFAQNNRDMEFAAWMDFLLKLICAICQIDPAEVNFVFGNHGQAAAMGQASSEDKITSSRNRWLRPWIRSYFDWLNKWVIWPLDEDFEIAPTGIDVESAQEAHKRKLDLVTHTHTVDEVRALDDLSPLPDGQGEVLLNQTWLQAKQGADATAMAEGDDEPPVVDPGEAESPDETAARLLNAGGAQEPQGPEPDDDGPPEPTRKSRGAGAARRFTLIV